MDEYNIFSDKMRRKQRKYQPNIFVHSEHSGNFPTVILPIAEDNIVDVWFWLSILHDTLGQGEQDNARDMVEWLAIMIFEGMEEGQKDAKRILRKIKEETKDFDSKLEAFMRELDDETEKPE
jgi:hypothetical protein